MSSLIAGTRIARRRTRVVISTAAALAATAALASPAGAAVNGSHVVATVPDSSALELSGYPIGDALDIHVIRNGVVIGSAADTTVQDPKAKGIVNPNTDGILNVNGGTPPCWLNSTPQILPGDQVTVADASGTDSMIVQNVEATSIDQAPNGDVLVHGFAIAPGGGRYDPATFDASVQARITVPAGGGLFSNGRNNVRAGATKTDGTIAYDPPAAPGDPLPTTWTADFPLPPSDAALALANKNIEGVFTVGISELTIGRSPVAGPTAGCPPTVRNGVTSFDRSAVNASNFATPLTVNGATQPDATSVTVDVKDANGKAAPGSPFTVTPSGGTFQIPNVDVSTLADGTITATSSVVTPAGTIGGSSQSILKDIVAPTPPIADPNPSAGPIPSGTHVSLADDDATAAIHYTTAGTKPAAASPVFGAPILVDHAMTIRAIAIDPAGNVSPEASFAFTLTAPPVVTPPAAGGGGGATPPAAGPTTIIQQIPFAVPVLPAQAVQGTSVSSSPSPSTAAGRPAVRGLRVAVSGRALRVSLRLGSGANVVRFRVFRVKNGRVSGRALVTLLRPASASGTYTLRGAALRRLRRGSYALLADAGRSSSALGAAATVVFALR